MLEILLHRRSPGVAFCLKKFHGRERTVPQPANQHTVPENPSWRIFVLGSGSSLVINPFTSKGPTLGYWRAVRRHKGYRPLRRFTRLLVCLFVSYHHLKNILSDSAHDQLCHHRHTRCLRLSLPYSPYCDQF